jgi:hypothetical protein
LPDPATREERKVARKNREEASRSKLSELLRIVNT